DYKIAVAAQVNGDQYAGANQFIDSAVEDFAQIIITELGGEKLSDAEKLSLNRIAEDWLQLIDAEKLGQSWDSISAELKAKYTRERWQSVMQSFLKKVGKFKSRKLKNVFQADSDRVAIDFESSFAKVPSAVETIILKLEDGKWQIASYSIK